MRHLLASTVLLSLCLTPVFAFPQHDRDDHQDRDEKHDKGDHHDNGRHEGWYKHGDREDDHRHWDYDHDRVAPGHAYPHGRYAYVRHSFIAQSFEIRTRRVILEDHSEWVVAPYDVNRCRDWRWDRDTVFVYDDDTHPGWYLLFNARVGQYAHVEFFGAH